MFDTAVEVLSPPVAAKLTTVPVSGSGSLD